MLFTTLYLLSFTVKLKLFLSEHQDFIWKEDFKKIVYGQLYLVELQLLIY